VRGLGREGGSSGREEKRKERKGGRYRKVE